MYHHQIVPFGEYQKHIFKNPISQNSFSIVPEAGGCVLDIVFQNNSILDGYKTPEELQFNKWAKNCLLYPFPNRLKDGQYQWEGKTYQFPINDSHTGNALHGFGMAKEMTVEDTNVTTDTAQITCTYAYDGKQEHYPFPFTITVKFEISDEQKFSVNIGIQNDGIGNIPIGWGWHPYFKLTDKVDDLSLQVPTCEWIGVDGRMIPTGKRYTYEEFKQMKKIGSTVLDNAFAVVKEAQESNFEVVLQSEQHRLNYWQETGENKYNFIQLFTPPYRSSIAIEPMTCNIDALNNQEGLLVLQAQERLTTTFGLNYERLS